MLKNNNSNVEISEAIEQICDFSEKEKPIIQNQCPTIKSTDKNKIYYRINYTKFNSFCHHIETAFQKKVFYEK